MTYRIITSKNPEEFADAVTEKLAEGFQFIGPIIIHEHGNEIQFVREMMRDSSVKPATAPQIRSIKQ